MHRTRMAPHTRMTPSNENDSRGCCSRTVKTSGCCSRTAKTLYENNTRPTKEKTSATLPRNNRAHISNNSPPQSRETCESRNSISLSNENSTKDECNYDRTQTKARTRVGRPMALRKQKQAPGPLAARVAQIVGPTATQSTTRGHLRVVAKPKRAINLNRRQRYRVIVSIVIQQVLHPNVPSLTVPCLTDCTFRKLLSL